MGVRMAASVLLWASLSPLCLTLQPQLNSERGTCLLQGV